MPSEQKTELMVFKTFLDEEKSKLLEISLRYQDPFMDLPKWINGNRFEILQKYLDQLERTIAECDEVRKMIAEQLRQAE